MNTRTISALSFGSILSVFTVQAGCSISFQLAIVDSAGQVVSNLPDLNWSNVYLVDLPPGGTFRSTVLFSSCGGGMVRISRNGVLLQESQCFWCTWTTNEPGTYECWFEGYGNMAQPPRTRTFVISAGMTTGLGPVFSTHGFHVNTLAVDGAGRAHLNCTSAVATDLHVQFVSLDGRVQHTSVHRIMPGENVVYFRLNSPAADLMLFRLRTTEGVTETRKVLF